MQRPYTESGTRQSKLLCRLSGQHPSNKSFTGYRAPNIPEEIRDAIAEKEFQQKLTGGYNTSKSNRCEKCFQVRSENGTCSCY